MKRRQKLNAFFGCVDILALAAGLTWISLHPGCLSFVISGAVFSFLLLLFFYSTSRGSWIACRSQAGITALTSLTVISGGGGYFCISQVAGPGHKIFALHAWSTTASVLFVAGAVLGGLAFLYLFTALMLRICNVK